MSTSAAKVCSVDDAIAGLFPQDSPVSSMELHPMSPCVVDHGADKLSGSTVRVQVSAKETEFRFSGELEQPPETWEAIGTFNPISPVCHPASASHFRSSREGAEDADEQSGNGNKTQEDLIQELTKRNTELTEALLSLERAPLTSCTMGTAIGSEQESVVGLSNGEQTISKSLEVGHNNAGSAGSPADPTSTTESARVRPGRRKRPPKQSQCPWTEEEHSKFLHALERFRTEETEAVGPDGRQSVGLGSRSVTQIRSHAQKYFQRKRKEQQGPQ
eukprot:CAMPEP_0181335664 /NCGR_PEP_ID=MMETSP1101-20121128/26964_1 /TAXON_ID=46948 /ORGANISM="Rhodomonas abbreviata, Strain Caron Lab Isolate" /LENGTH=273 /DNA_ID=CAMNT_0023445823 /DNA_START=21 /DNA_END=842 /DNA_ORIENTATION=+